MDFLTSLFSPTPIAGDHLALRMILALLVAFIAGQSNAWLYKWTHRGVSYSRNFTQALILISIVSAISMSLVAFRPLVAVGLLGGMAIIRFRTVVRDARDTSYVFLSLICGMAAGFGFYGAAVLGSVACNLVALYLHFTSFGSWYAADSLLRFRINASVMDGGSLDKLLRKFCRRFTVVSVDECTPGNVDDHPVCQCAYKIRLRDPHLGPDLVAAMKQSLPIDAVHLLVEQEYDEVD